jgi:RNA polymerase sigma-70 factor, ECF subfamily
MRIGRGRVVRDSPPKKETLGNNSDSVPPAGLMSQVHLTGSQFHCLIGRMDKAENEIIKLVLAGNRDAYRVLVENHYQFAFRIACRIAGDPDDAEEVAQEAFLRAYTQLHTFRHDSSFSTWVNRIAMNQALNLVERRKRDLLQAPEQIADSPSRDGAVQLADRKAGPERLLLDREFASLRQAAMATLTPMERTAFTLRHMEELPIAEIGAALHIPANSAKQAVFRAVGKLRRALAPAVQSSGGVR